MVPTAQIPTQFDCHEHDQSSWRIPIWWWHRRLCAELAWNWVLNDPQNKKYSHLDAIHPKLMNKMFMWFEIAFVERAHLTELSQYKVCPPPFDIPSNLWTKWIYVLCLLWFFFFIIFLVVYCDRDTPQNTAPKRTRFFFNLKKRLCSFPRNHLIKYTKILSFDLFVCVCCLCGGFRNYSHLSGFCVFTHSLDSQLHSNTMKGWTEGEEAHKAFNKSSVRRAQKYITTTYFIVCRGAGSQYAFIFVLGGFTRFFCFSEQKKEYPK